MALPHHDRFPYHAIRERWLDRWPDGSRLAVYIGLNLEHFAFGEGLGAELAPGGPQPDVLNYAWRDYGNRVGAWRMLDLFDELSLPATVLVNSDHPRPLPRACRCLRRARRRDRRPRPHQFRAAVGFRRRRGARLIAEATEAIATAFRQAAGRLARALDRREPEHAGPAQGSRLYLPARLVP